MGRRMEKENSSFLMAGLRLVVYVGTIVKFIIDFHCMICMVRENCHITELCQVGMEKNKAV